MLFEIHRDRSERTLRGLVGSLAVAGSMALGIGSATAEDAAAPPQLENFGAELLDSESSASASGEARETRDAGAAAAPASSELRSASTITPSLADWFRMLTERMHEAESALAALDATGRGSAAQQQVVSELDARIAALQRQCEQCGGQSTLPPQTRPSQPTSSGGQRGGQPGEAGAATAATPSIDRPALGRLVTDLWGQLPERQREELLQPLGEEFLPKYAAEVEEYFRSLAEPREEPAP